MELQCTKDMPPAKRQQTATTAFLKGQRQRRQTYTDADNLAVLVPVLNERHQVKVDILQVHLCILLHLTLRELRITIEMTVSVVDDLENFVAIATLENIITRELLHVEVITLLNDL